MTTKVVPGQLVTLREAALVAEEAATRIAEPLRAAQKARGEASVALSGGNTPRDAYFLLAREAGIDWAKVQVFWVDERVAAPTDDRSNYRWAKATLLDTARIPPSQIHRMLADSADLEAAARAYEATVRASVPADEAGVPSFDVAILGVGDDGHTASLFPGETTVDITDRLVVAVPARGTREARMTLTPPCIEHARHVFVLAVGAAKAEPLQRVWRVQGNLHETPARITRACKGELVWIIDRAAAGLD